jgi:hypothetical protein
MSILARTPLRAAAALAAVLLAACGGSDKTTGPNPGGNTAQKYGTSTTTSAGGVTTSVQGVALYGRLAEQAGEGGFQIALGSFATEGTFDNVVVIGRENSATPAAGTYALHDATGLGEDEEDEDEAPADAFQLIAVLQSAGRDLLCAAKSGTLTVQSVGGGRMRGNYQATVTCVDMTNQQSTQTSLSGTFEAVDGTGLVSLPMGARLTDGGQVTPIARARR